MNETDIEVKIGLDLDRPEATTTTTTTADSFRSWPAASIAAASSQLFMAQKWAQLFLELVCQRIHTSSLLRAHDKGLVSARQRLDSHNVSQRVAPS